MKVLKEHGRITVREEKKPRKGRPYKIYSLKIGFNDIVAQLENEPKKAVNEERAKIERWKEIKHIKARVKHPQTNGKVEKWFDLYEKFRSEFETFADFVKWYNTIRFHESLDQKRYLQTPENAFWARLPACSKLNIFLKRMEIESNVYGRK